MVKVNEIHVLNTSYLASVLERLRITPLQSREGAGFLHTGRDRSKDLNRTVLVHDDLGDPDSQFLLQSCERFLAFLLSANLFSYFQATNGIAGHR